MNVAYRGAGAAGAEMVDGEELEMLGPDDVSSKAEQTPKKSNNASTPPQPTPKPLLSEAAGAAAPAGGVTWKAVSPRFGLILNRSVAPSHFPTRLPKFRVRLTALTLGCAAKVHVPKPERHGGCRREVRCNACRTGRVDRDDCSPRSPCKSGRAGLPHPASRITVRCACRAPTCLCYLLKSR